MPLGENPSESRMIKQFTEILASLRTSMVMRVNRLTSMNDAEWNEIIDKLGLLIDLCEQAQVLQCTEELYKMADSIRKLLNSIKNKSQKERIMNDSRIAYKIRQIILPAISLGVLREKLMEGIPDPPPLDSPSDTIQHISAITGEEVEAVISSFPHDPTSSENINASYSVDPLEHANPQEENPPLQNIPSISNADKSDITPSTPSIPQKTLEEQIEEQTKGKLQSIEDCLQEALKNRTSDGHSITIEMWLTKKGGEMKPHIVQIRKMMGAAENQKDTIVANYNSHIGKLELEIITRYTSTTIKRLRLKIGVLLLQPANLEKYGRFFLAD